MQYLMFKYQGGKKKRISQVRDYKTMLCLKKLLFGSVISLCITHNSQTGRELRAMLHLLKTFISQCFTEECMHSAEAILDPFPKLSRLPTTWTCAMYLLGNCDIEGSGLHSETSSTECTSWRR